MNYLGNKDILKLKKAAFLCSRKCPAEVVLKSYDWAKEQREQGNCIVCGNHSQIEKDVFGLLLKGSQPLILVLARSMKKKWEPEILKEVNKGRLLIISPFENIHPRITKETAEMRNRYMIEMADELKIAYTQKGGMLEKLIIEKGLFNNKLM